MNFDHIVKLGKKNVIRDLPKILNPKIYICKSCQIVKQVQVPFKSEESLLGPYNTSVFPYYCCHYSPLLLLLCPCCPHIVIIDLNRISPWSPYTLYLLPPICDNLLDLKNYTPATINLSVSSHGFNPFHCVMLSMISNLA